MLSGQVISSLRVAARLERVVNMNDFATDHNNDEPAENPARAITTLARREVQAPLLACLLDGFIRVLGREKALQVASASIREDAMQAGKAFAEKYGGNSIADLLRVVREGWAQEEALTFEILEQTGRSLCFDVTRCRYTEMYARLGLQEFGFCFSCNRDESFIQGFNPRCA